MKQLPTAENLLQNIGMDMYDEKYHNIKSLLIEFAKLHVESALEVALEDAPYGSSTDTVSYEDMKDAILNAYPLDNIK